MNNRKISLVILISAIWLTLCSQILLAQEAAPPTGTKFDYHWFDTNRLNVFITLAIVFSAILWFIARAKKGKSLFIRSVAGLDAIEEAVGRATEMGKWVLYIPGIHDMNDRETGARVGILGIVPRPIA